MTGVGRTSIREALRQLEAEGLVVTVPHRGPEVSTISLAEAEQLYEMRAMLEGYAGRECARRRDPDIIARLRREVERLHAVVRDDNWGDLLSTKTEFYAALLEGCGNVFAQRFLRMLHNRVTLLRMTSMAHSGRIENSLVEISEILHAIEAGDPERAERACLTHIRNAAEVALAVLKQQQNSNEMKGSI
jgi:DNA-binding GntR family transcriptional regulator